MMHPGIYVRKRRTASGLSIEDLAAIVATDPHLHEIDRAEWLRRIEAGEAPVSDDVARALVDAAEAGQLRMDPLVLGRLLGIQAGEDIPAPRLCRVCACSEWDACRDFGGAGCAWVAPDLCSCCPRDSMAAAA